MAGFGDARRKGEETVLAERLEGRKRLTIHIARGGPETHAKATERVVRIRLERRQEDPPGVVAVIAHGGIAQTVVRNSIKDTHGVCRPALHQIPRDLVAYVTAGHQQSGQPALGEIGIVVGLQTLKTHRWLEFAYTHFGPGEVLQFRVGIVDNRRPLAEIGTEEIVDVFIDGAGKRGAYPPQ